MTRVPMTQAVAADYADAMLVARRAKNVLFFFLTLVLLVQLGLFFVVRYVPSVKVRSEPAVSFTDAAGAAAPATTAPATTAQASRWNWPRTLRFWISCSDFLGVTLSMVLPAILLLVVAIMLVGRLVGVSHVTSAFCWSIVFLVILFPWQSLLNGHTSETSVPGISANPLEPLAQRPEITFPGVLYTYPELAQNYDFASNDFKNEGANIVLKWMRFVGWPVVELILLLMIQGRSSRGLRFALGEADLPLDVGPTTTGTV